MIGIWFWMKDKNEFWVMTYLVHQLPFTIITMWRSIVVYTTAVYYYRIKIGIIAYSFLFINQLSNQFIQLRYILYILFIMNYM